MQLFYYSSSQWLFMFFSPNKRWNKSTWKVLSIIIRPYHAESTAWEQQVLYIGFLIIKLTE